jgi:hypothetical protein
MAIVDIIDTAQLTSDCIAKKHIADDSVHAHHIQNNTIEYAKLNTTDGIGQRAVTTTQAKLQVHESGVTSNSSSIKTFIDSKLNVTLSAVQVTSWGDVKYGLNLPNNTSVMVGVELKHNTFTSDFASRQARIYYKNVGT